MISDNVIVHIPNVSQQALKVSSVSHKNTDLQPLDRRVTSHGAMITPGKWSHPLFRWTELPRNDLNTLQCAGILPTTPRICVSQGKGYKGHDNTFTRTETIDSIITQTKKKGEDFTQIKKTQIYTII